MKRDKTFNYLIAILLIIIAVFAIGMPYGFLTDWDDGVFVVNNTNMNLSLRSLAYFGLHPFMDLWTPLPMYSLTVDHSLFGLWAPGYHLHNLLLHCGCAVLFFYILKTLKCNNFIAFIATLLWALHPQKVESVIWITERKDVQCGLFFFAAILCFLKKRMGWSALLTFLAIASKPATICLPGIFAVYLLFIDQREWKKGLWPIASGVLCFIINTIITSGDITASLEPDWMVPLHNLFWYPLTTLIPFELNPIYPTAIAWDSRLLFVIGMGLLLFVAGTAVAAAWHCGWKKILTALLIIWGTTVPVIGMLRYTDYRYCDRYNYLVTSAVLCAIALLFQQGLRRGYFDRRRTRLPLIGFAVTIVILFAARTYMYIPYWENTQYMTYYGLQRPGIINPKLYDVACSSAINANNLEYLEYLNDLLDTRKIAFYQSDERHIRLYKMALSGQIAMIKRDANTARRNYYGFVEEALKLKSLDEIKLPMGVKAALYLNLSKLAAADGDEKAAQFYRNQLEEDDREYKRLTKGHLK